MTTKELIKNLEDITLDYTLAIHSCNLEQGIHFFLPAPASPVPGTIFVGSASDWINVRRQEKLCNECTYLICMDRNSLPAFPTTNLQINIVYLNASSQTVVSRLVSLVSKTRSAQSPSITQLYKSFWHDILNQDITTQNQVMERLTRFPFQVHKHIACIVVRHAKSLRNTDTIHKITRVLQNFFPNTNIFYNEKEWIVLYSQKKDTSDNLDISYQDFSDLLEHYQLYAGISYACQLPEVLRTLYLTADASIELGKRLAISSQYRRIYTYHQYNPYYVIHLCSCYFRKLHNTENLMYLTHPDITRLYYHDLENNNNLLDVLYSYLCCGQNLNRASQKLHMHRNTVLNKLNKINDFLQHDFDYESDHFLLLLSCMIMHYQGMFLQKDVDEFFSSHSFDHLSNEQDNTDLQQECPD
ncbi:MAG: hypothetical protein E7256_04055 [Lachnospiraceae bacterium]|nr:hypothetical protein [Lachnospiraceae bacterium]